MLTIDRWVKPAYQLLNITVGLFILTWYWWFFDSNIWTRWLYMSQTVIRSLLKTASDRGLKLSRIVAPCSKLADKLTIWFKYLYSVITFVTDHQVSWFGQLTWNQGIASRMVQNSRNWYFNHIQQAKLQSTIWMSKIQEENISAIFNMPNCT